VSRDSKSTWIASRSGYNEIRFRRFRDTGASVNQKPI